MSTTKLELNLTSASILRVLGYLFGFWFLYQTRSILVTLFVAFIFMTAIRPLVRHAAHYKIPSIVVVLSIFALTIALASTLVASLVPAVITETRGLVSNLPTYLGELETRFGLSLDQQLLLSEFGSIPSNILSLAAGAFGNILTVLAVFFMTYYLIVERPHLHKYLVQFFGQTDAESASEAFIQEVETRVGGWVRGQLLLMLVIGLMTYVGLLLLGIPYALPLATLAGLLEAVPNLGPTISAIPAILLGLTMSPITALGALAMSILIQQLENNLIVPKIMQAATGVAPLMTIIVLMVGYTLGGIIGTVLAMPLYLAFDSMLKHLRLIKRSS